MDLMALEELAKTNQAKMSIKMKLTKEKYFVEVLGKKLIILPNVFYPHADTLLLINSAKVKSTDSVLEPFSGTGAISIFLAEKASSVVATDINPDAIKNINENIKLHHLENKMKAIQANIFPNKDTYDIIVANPPYTNNVAKDLAEKAFWDEEHKTTKLFLQEAKKHLTKNGKIYCSWANFANFDYFEQLVKSNNYKIKQTNEITKDWAIYRVYKITLK